MSLKIFTDNIDEKAKDQVLTLMEHEAFKNSKVRIMPDVHAGKGCVIGFTANIKDKIVPSIVGVDIGCGMFCVALYDKHLDLAKLDSVIKNFIPSGTDVHENENKNQVESAKSLITQLRCFDRLKSKENRLYKSLGTLGGGNHFIEIDVDSKGNNYLIIHTGSRNLGAQVATIYQNMAIEKCSFKKECDSRVALAIQNLKDSGKHKEISKTIVNIREEYKDKVKIPQELCYLEGQDMENYLHDMLVCLTFASANRQAIANEILEQMGWTQNVRESFGTIHNYIDNQGMVRKGAISARLGERVLIPMNMRDGCLIAMGKGNEDWNYSAPHGAGRIMSRNACRESLTMLEYTETMQGIYSTSINESTLDEAPMAYKPMKEIIDCIKGTVDIQKIIKPIYNFKANS